MIEVGKVLLEEDIKKTTTEVFRYRMFIRGKWYEKMDLRYIIIPFVVDTKYRIIEVENYDRFRILPGEYDLGKCLFPAVSGDAKFIAYFDGTSRKLKLIPTDGKNVSYDFGMSERMEDNFVSVLGWDLRTEQFNPCSLSMVFSVSNKYFFCGRGGDGDGEIMVIDLCRNQTPFLKCVIPTVGYPYNGQQVLKHPIYENYVLCSSYTDYSPTFEIFKLSEDQREQKKFDVIFQKDIECEMDLVWNENYVAWCIGSEIRVAKFDHEKTLKSRLIMSEYEVIPFFDICKRITGFSDIEGGRSYKCIFLGGRNIFYIHVAIFFGESDDDKEVYLFFDLENSKYSYGCWDIFERSDIISPYESSWKLEAKGIPDIHISRVYIPPEIIVNHIFSFLDYSQIVRKVECVCMGFRNNMSIWQMIYKRDWKLIIDVPNYEKELKIDYFKRYVRKDRYLQIRSILDWKDFKFFL